LGWIEQKIFLLPQRANNVEKRSMPLTSCRHRILLANILLGSCRVIRLLSNLPRSGCLNDPLPDKYFYILREKRLQRTLQLNNFIKEKHVGQQGADMQRGIEIIDELG